MNDEHACRTAPATLGLLTNTFKHILFDQPLLNIKDRNGTELFWFLKGKI